MAAASGLSLLTTDERDPIRATSIGTGDLSGPRSMPASAASSSGIGGSATTDGGAGLLPASGPCRPGHGPWISPTSIRGSPRSSCEVACDVVEPAAADRPGRRPSTARRRARRPTTSSDARRADAVVGRRAGGARPVGASATTPGAGAAGGVGFALLAIQDRFRSFALRPGRRPRDGRHRLRRAARAGRPRHHRRGPDRRPDRLRQDRARRRAAGRRRRACPASRSVAASSSTGSRPSRRSARSPSRSSERPQIGRGGDGRRYGAPRTLRRADRPAGRNS